MLRIACSPSMQFQRAHPRQMACVVGRQHCSAARGGEQHGPHADEAARGDAELEQRGALRAGAHVQHASHARAQKVHDGASVRLYVHAVYCWLRRGSEREMLPWIEGQVQNAAYAHA